MSMNVSCFHTVVITALKAEHWHKPPGARHSSAELGKRGWQGRLLCHCTGAEKYEKLQLFPANSYYGVRQVVRQELRTVTR